MRETIESVVVAFILAFLFKTFEAEAFVIPTGSMAPTLLGRNKDAVCPKCGTHFTIGASDEVESETDYVIPGARITSAVCPNCRYRLGEDLIKDVPVFKGDRILVTKFSFEVKDPQRFDVVVFKYPEEPKINYIKRCIGLPNETIEIRQGNVYRVTDSGTEILRKTDPNKQRVLQLRVYDNDHPERALLSGGWPERWAAVKKAASTEAIAGWSPDSSGGRPTLQARSFHLAGGGKDLRWFRYRNFVPKSSDWETLASGQPLNPPRPELITDFCGYNAFSSPHIPAEDPGLYWVGDLTINCHVDVKEHQPDGEVVLDLNEGARSYRCHLELATGRATLAYAEPHDANDLGEEHKLAERHDAVRRTGRARSLVCQRRRSAVPVDRRPAGPIHRVDRLHALRRRLDSEPLGRRSDSGRRCGAGRRRDRVALCYYSAIFTTAMISRVPGRESATASQVAMTKIFRTCRNTSGSSPSWSRNSTIRGNGFESTSGISLPE